MIFKLFVIYLVVINLTGFVSMGRDKRKAVKRLRRTPERRLMAFALLGGSVGCLLGMLIFRHKTKHRKFTLGVPVILAVQIAIAALAVIYL